MLARDGRERATNTKCAGRAHGWLEASGETYSDWCGSLKRFNGHGGDANKANCHVQTRADGKVDARDEVLLERGN